MLGPLAAGQWQLAHARPRAGRIADQVSHLAYFDEATLLSVRDPDRFRREAAALAGRGDDFPDRSPPSTAHLGGAELLRLVPDRPPGLLDGFAGADPAARLPWYGPDMSPASSVTARLMETWAHGQDIADTLGVERPADRPAAARRPPRGAQPALQLRGQRPAAAGRPGPGRAGRARTAAQWTWGPQTPRTGSPAPRSTSAWWSPSGGTAADTALVDRGPDRRPVDRDRAGLRRAAAGAGPRRR